MPGRAGGTGRAGCAGRSDWPGSAWCCRAEPAGRRGDRIGLLRCAGSGGTRTSPPTVGLTRAGWHGSATASQQSARPRSRSASAPPVTARAPAAAGRPSRRSRRTRAAGPGAVRPRHRRHVVAMPAAPAQPSSGVAIRRRRCAGTVGSAVAVVAGSAGPGLDRGRVPGRDRRSAGGAPWVAGSLHGAVGAARHRRRGARRARPAPDRSAELTARTCSPVGAGAGRARLRLRRRPAGRDRLAVHSVPADVRTGGPRLSHSLHRPSTTLTAISRYARHRADLVQAAGSG